jgi:glutaredoxin
MKKFLLAVAALVLWQHWDAVASLWSGPEDYSAYQAEDVVLYATSWCGYCEKTRRFLKSSRIAYVEHDIERSAEGRRQYERLGGRGVPLVLVGRTIVRGYDPRAIVEALKQSEAQPTAW